MLIERGAELTITDSSNRTPLGYAGFGQQDPEVIKFLLGLPLPDKSVPLRFIPLRNQAIATFGIYRRFKAVAGEISGHVINPASGGAMSKIYTSVAVVADRAARADALATALFAMGVEAELDYVAKNNIAAIFICRVADGFEERGSQAMKAIVQ